VRRAGQTERDLARGPARLCQALGIDRSLNGADVCDPASPLRLRTGSGALAPVAGAVLAARPGGRAGGSREGATGRSGERFVINTGPRVGVREGAEVPWRFWLDDEPTVSAYRAHVPRRR
jgi:DNA-3-methyladenine glycosylase